MIAFTSLSTAEGEGERGTVVTEGERVTERETERESEIVIPSTRTHPRSHPNLHVHPQQHQRAYQTMLEVIPIGPNHQTHTRHQALFMLVFYIMLVGVVIKLWIFVSTIHSMILTVISSVLTIILTAILVYRLYLVVWRQGLLFDEETEQQAETERDRERQRQSMTERDLEHGISSMMGFTNAIRLPQGSPFYLGLSPSGHWMLAHVTEVHREIWARDVFEQELIRFVYTEEDKERIRKLYRMKRMRQRERENVEKLEREKGYGERENRVLCENATVCQDENPYSERAAVYTMLSNAETTQKDERSDAVTHTEISCTVRVTAAAPAPAPAPALPISDTSISSESMKSDAIVELKTDLKPEPKLTLQKQETENASDDLIPTICAICLEDFQEQDHCVCLPLCSHIFHQPCLMTWIQQQNACPLCKHVVSHTPRG
jgi:hypothetical protein